jgi:replicative DNA helicase
MTTSHQDDAARARYAIQNVLDGNPPNGTKPEDCGPWKDPVEAIFHAWDVGGTEKAIAILPTLIKAAPGLDKLLSEGKPAPSTWGGILPFHSADLPPFPLDIFPPWLREYCEAVTETMQTPPDLAGMLALSILSTACAQRVAIRVWNGWIEPVNVYTVTSLPPASRKSPVFRAMMGPVTKFEQDLSDKVADEIFQAKARQDILKQQIEDRKRKAAKAETAQGSKHAFAEIEELGQELKELVVPEPPKLIVDDITPERVAGVLADQNGRIAVLSPEGDIFGIMAGRYSAGPPNIGVYLKGHAAETVRVDRQTRAVHVKNAAITIGVTTQPEVMRSFGSNNAFRGQGLLARFFYALPRSTVGNRKSRTEAIPDDVKRRYFHLVLMLLENMYSVQSVQSVQTSDSSVNSDQIADHYDSNILYYVNLNSEAQHRIAQFHDWIEPRLGDYGDLHYMGDWAGKLAGAAVRVAGLLHMAETLGQNGQNGQITDNEMARGIRLAHYLLAHAQAAYAEIGADPALDAAKTILRWIEKAGEPTFTRRDCYRGVRGPLFKSADDCDAPLRLLADHGYIREVETPDRSGAGRKPSPAYEVNPTALGQNGQNGQNAPGEPPTGASYEQPGYREIGGYDE